MGTSNAGHKHLSISMACHISSHAMHSAWWHLKQSQSQSQWQSQSYAIERYKLFYAGLCILLKNSCNQLYMLHCLLCHIVRALFGAEKWSFRCVRLRCWPLRWWILSWILHTAHPVHAHTGTVGKRAPCKHTTTARYTLHRHINGAMCVRCECECVGACNSRRMWWW